MSDGYWTPLRDEGRLYWRRHLERLEAEERDRREWIEGVKRRLGIRCIGDEEQPVWPVLDYVPPGSKWTVVSDQAMASYDGVHWLVKPEGMTSAEFFASLPSAASAAPAPPTYPR